MLSTLVFEAASHSPEVGQADYNTSTLGFGIRVRVYIYGCVPDCVYKHRMYVGVCGGQKRMSDPLELEL